MPAGAPGGAPAAAPQAEGAAAYSASAYSASAYSASALNSVHGCVGLSWTYPSRSVSYTHLTLPTKRIV